MGARAPGVLPRLSRSCWSQAFKGLGPRARLAAPPACLAPWAGPSGGQERLLFLGWEWGSWFAKACLSLGIIPYWGKKAKINFFEGNNKKLLAVLRFPGNRDLQGSEQSLLGYPHRLVLSEETPAWEEDPQV